MQGRFWLPQLEITGVISAYSNASPAFLQKGRLRGCPFLPSAKAWGHETRILRDILGSDVHRTLMGKDTESPIRSPPQKRDLGLGVALAESLAHGGGPEHPYGYVM